MKIWTCVHDAKASCGEGLLWDPSRNCLWWVDIANETLHRHDPQTGENRTIRMPYLISALALHDDGSLVIATINGLGLVDDIDGEITILHDPEPDLPGNRLNDIITAPDGALWAGTMSEGAKGATGALYRYGANGPAPVKTATTISNGMGWSPDGATLYFIDSVPGTLFARQDEQWSVVRQFDDTTGKPDGMTVDTDGTLWIAICDRGQVIGMNDQGEIIETISLPCEIVTNCTFGGPDLRRLYVTTGTFSMSADEKAANPAAGGLFAIEMDVPGVVPFRAKWPTA